MQTLMTLGNLSDPQDIHAMSLTWNLVPLYPVTRYIREDPNDGAWRYIGILEKEKTVALVPSPYVG